MMIMLMMFSMGLEAKIKVELGGENNDGVYKGGTIVEKGQTDPDDKGLVTVTITVTPQKGYTISQKDIVVVSTFSPSGASATRAPEIAANLTPIEKDPEDLSQPRDYSYIVSSTFGIWVKEANFAYSRKGGDPSTATSITSLSQITDPDGYYTLASTFSTTGDRVTNENGKEIGSADNPFKGTIDGGLVTITGTWNKPLFDCVEDATIKNVIIGSASVSGSACVGTIAGTAKGASRIYNCGILNGTVGSSGAGTDNPKTANACGGLVGLLEGTSRVVNCYSYATITGGNRVGGIVGYNNATTTAGNIQTMVMNCMFYGDITAGNKVSPVYGGTEISNLKHNSDRSKDGLNTFNYYSYENLKSKAIDLYNCALAVEEKYLNRFEFYRLLLNSNKKLAAFYASTSTYTVNASDMAKWVLETADRTINNPKPYPILKAQGKYPSIINYDAEHAPASTSVGRNHGGKLGKTLKIHLSGTGITTDFLEIDRTDKDFDRFNYNYDKIQLPYFNDVGTGNYTDNKVVTGWKITKMDGGTAGTFTAADEWDGYNFADRKCTNKDIYSATNTRVFSQGAYFDVPYDVTDIYIEPYWGMAAYVSDEYMDVVNTTGYGAQSITQLGRYYGTNGVSVIINGSSQKVYNSIGNALKQLTGINSPSVYDYAVVLVGNVHQSSVPSQDTKPFTLMSIDQDKDNEPDYSLIYHHIGKKRVSPIRFDFLNIPGTAQAQKPKEADNICNMAIIHPSAWFEITNSALLYFSQFEYEDLVDNSNRTDGPLILQGGIFDQFVSTNNSVVNGKTLYMHLGGNVWLKEFNMGTHSDGSNSTPHPPVSVTGGEYEGFYLTGTYNQDAAVRKDNAECYISGGYFKEAAGTGQEAINGDVRWQIYNADIDNFFGGGSNGATGKNIKGDVRVDIYNSYVTNFCGGPKFGNMEPGKKVTTNAEGCVFGKFFGAGYGGTAYSRKKYYDKDGTPAWGTTLQGYYTKDRGNYFDGTKASGNALGDNAKYGYKGIGVATDFDYEYFVWSSGKTGGRFFVKFASFSLAQCNNVESNLTNCTINEDFYGGGSLGKVTGTAKSVLDGCTVMGNVFGGGYSAKIPTIEVRNAGFTTVPNYNKKSGMFEPAVFSGTTTFEWKHVDNLPNNNNSGIKTETVDGKTINYVLTDADLTTLGQVQNVDLTIKGSTYVRGMIYKYDDDGTTIVSSEQTGGVFGGGDESTVNGNTKVDVQGTAESGINNVYGGGNTADVDGGATVSVTGGKMKDVYGGGRGETTTVKGDVTVHIGKSFKTDGSVDKTGSPSIEGSVYGGSALGKVNETEGKETKVNIYGGTIDGNAYGGTINESVYGGGKGEKTSNSDIAAMTFGNVTVTVEGGTVNTAVYGGSNANGVLKKNSTVTVTGGTVGTSTNPISNVVFGGGYGQPTLVEGSVEVNIGTSGQSTDGAIINGHVYGGGALGNVNTSKPESALVFDATKTTAVNLYKGTINGDAYGGGLGNTETAAYVGGDVNVLLDGAKITGSVFGCNNLNGTPKGHVKVHVKRTVDSSKPTVDGENNPIGRDSRTTYDVAAV